MIGISDYKKAIDKVYKKVVGKTYRDEMIKKNNDDLHIALVNADKDQYGFEYYSTSNETYNLIYKNFLEKLKVYSKHNVERGSKYYLDLHQLLLMSVLLGGMSVVTAIPFLFKPDVFILIITTFLGLASFFTFRELKKNDKENLKDINKAVYEKTEISKFFQRYKSALGLQETSLFFTHQTNDQKSMNRVEEVEYGAIQKVFLTAHGEEIEFTNKYVNRSTLPEKTIIETDLYKTAAVKTLNLLMPDNTIFSVIGPTGPNGETVEELRDIIERKMDGVPLMNVNNYTYSDDDTIKV